MSDLPVPFSERSSTDLFCTIITAIFAIAMFVTACVVFNNQKLAYMTYPTDGEGHKCTLDNPTYNYLYFTTINDPVHIINKSRAKDSAWPNVPMELKIC